MISADMCMAEWVQASHRMGSYAAHPNLVAFTAAITISSFPFPVYHPIPQSGTWACGNL
jgi:hypothetical protein